MPRSTRARAGLLAAGLVVLSQLLAAIVRGIHPFGPGNDNVNDLWNQLLPFHTHVGRLVRGEGPSDWQYNWSSGLGVPWLPDFGTYLAGPGTVLASLAPPEHMDVAVAMASTAMMVAAAVAMVCYLHHLRQDGPWWLLGLVGGAYGINAWAVAEASYVPMWLGGLVALPMLALVGEWARANRHFVLSVLVVAVAWWSNYYTAYMATIGAVVLVALRLLADGARAREWLGTVARFAVRGVLGVGIAMALLLPVLTAIRSGAPGVEAEIVLPNQGFLERMLPATELLSKSPAMGTSALVLVFAFAFPFVSRISVRERAVYLVGTALLLGSMALPATAIMWHAMTVPNGSAYRAAFVASGFLVVLAWLAAAGGAAQRTAGLPVLVGAGLLAALLATAWRSTPEMLSTVTAASVAAALVAVAAWRWLPPRLLGGWVPAAVVCVAVLVEAGLGSAAMLDLRERRIQPIEMARTGLLVPPLEDVEGKESLPQWPYFRTAYRPTDYRSMQNNLPATVGEPGMSYYSSLVPGEVTEAYQALGGPYLGYGRSLGEPTEPVLSGLLGFRSVVGTAPGEATVGTADAPAFPVVRIAEPAGEVPSPGPYGVREELLSGSIHEIPELTLDGEGPLGEPTLEEPFSLSGTCTPGSSLLFSEFEGQYTMAFLDTQAFEVSTRGTPQNVGTGTVFFGRVPDDGTFTLRFWDVTRPAMPRQGHVACADMAEFSRQATASHDTAPDQLEMDGGHIRAAWDEPVTGDVVVATLNLTGWTCSADGRDAGIDRRGGLMAIPVEAAHEVECHYRSPGLAPGLAVSLAALGLTAVGGLLTARGHRRRGPKRAVV